MVPGAKTQAPPFIVREGGGLKLYNHRHMIRIVQCHRARAIPVSRGHESAQYCLYVGPDEQRQVEGRTRKAKPIIHIVIRVYVLDTDTRYNPRKTGGHEVDPAAFNTGKTGIAEVESDCRAMG